MSARIWKYRRNKTHKNWRPVKKYRRKALLLTVTSVTDTIPGGALLLSAAKAERWIADAYRSGLLADE